MIFAFLTSRARRSGLGRAPRKRRWVTPAAASGLGLGVVSLLLVGGWWLTDRQASGGAAEVVVIDVPHRGGSSGANGTSGATSEGEAAVSALAGGRMSAKTGREGDRQPSASGGAAEETMMVPAPQPALLEEGPYGPLPKIAADGRKPWQVYKKPSDLRDTRPRIAVVVTGFGLSTAASQDAIRRLPSEVTLSVDAYAAAPQTWAPKAREAGHEILLSLPLESSDFPFRDPGPSALLTSLPVADNLDRLQQLLSRCAGYVGVVSVLGRRFEQDQDSLRPVLEFLAQRGLMYVGGETSAASLPSELADETEFPRIVVDMWIDEEATPRGIDRALAQLEATARERAVAVGVARNSPLTIARLAAWAASLEQKDIALVPVSAIAGRQLLP